ncbi:MAG: ribosome recycling factor [Clostridia bacterium]|nr:ribosome recycling factor [Clostridia bacterium]
MEKIEMILLESEERMDKAVTYLKNDFLAIRAGRANPHVLDKVQVDYYGQMSPINQVGNISVSEGKCLVIAPWDKSLLKVIEKAIQVSDIGINPINDGNVIRLVFPDLTEERRRDLVKQIKKMAEDSKVAVRNVRRDTLDTLKKMKNAKEITDDEYAGFEAQVEKLTTKNVEIIDKAQQEKEKELMTV